MVANLLKLANLDWAVPDHTTLSRRQKTLAVQIPDRRAGGPLNLLVDSTGIKCLGTGALSADCFAIACRVTNGRRASMAFRADWKRWTGYHVQSRIEAKMLCLRAFDERIAARHPDSQTAEIQIRVALINRFNALGTAEIVRLG